MTEKAPKRRKSDETRAKKKELRIQAMCKIIRKYGVSDGRAALVSGVPSSTLADWNKADPCLSERFEAKREAWRQDNVKIIKDAARDGTWQAAAWLLERTTKEEYAPATAKHKVEHSGKVVHKMVFEDQLDTEEDI